MHEATLRDFLAGTVDADAVRRDLVGTVEQLGERVYRHHIASLAGEFDVTPLQLVRLCDAVLAGDLQPRDLETIGFCLVASDYFCWDSDTPDGSVVADTLHDWSSPEINYPLTEHSVRLFRERLLTREDALRDTPTA